MERTWNHSGGKMWQLESGIEKLNPTQSLGWEHYEVHEPEPHILLFKYALPN